MGLVIFILLTAFVLIVIMPISAMTKASSAMRLANQVDHKLGKALRRVDILEVRLNGPERSAAHPSAAETEAEKEQAEKPVVTTDQIEATKTHPTVSDEPPQDSHPPLDLSQDKLTFAPLRDDLDKPAIEQRAAAYVPRRDDKIRAEHPAQKTARTPESPRPAATASTAESIPSTTAASPRSPGKAVIEDSSGWEERIGTKLAVWVGAVALALAGLYLVRFAYEQEWLTPLRRVLSATAFGVALLGAGEWFRANMHRIAQGLTAAGIAVLFGTVLSATHLHEMIEAITGFGLLIAVTALAVALSLRQGPFVAILGLVGGFLTPALIGTHNVSTVQLFGYLFLLEAGLLALTRHRNWWWLGLATMLGGLGWAAVWLTFFHGEHPDGGAWVGLFLLMSIATFVAGSIRSQHHIGVYPVSKLIPWSGVAVGLVLVAWLLGAGEMTTLEWAYMGVLGAGCLVLGRVHQRFMGLAVLAAGMGLAMLIVWRVSGVVAADELRFALTTLCLGVMYAGGAYACLFGATRPVRWAAICVLSGVAYMLVGYWALHDVEFMVAWWAMSLSAACVMTQFAILILKRRDTLTDGESVLGVLLTGTTAFVALAVPLFVNAYDFGPQWMTIAFALQTAAVAFIAWRVRVPMLHKAVAALGSLVAVRLLINPMVLTYDIGTLPVLNWLAYGYGLPLACFVVTAWVLRRDGVGGARQLARRFDIGAITIGFVMVTLMVRHGFHGDMTVASLTLYEMATYSIAWAVGAGGLLVASRRWSLVLLERGGVIIAAAAMIAAAVGVGVIINPMWNLSASRAVGDTVIFNGLLYAIALPTLLAAWLSWLLRRARNVDIAELFDVGVLALVMLTLTLFVRHGFHPESMRLTEGVTLYELTTYGIVWLVLSSAMLAMVPRTALPALATMAKVVIALALVALTIGTGLAKNPLWDADAAQALGSWPVLNGLLYVLALPTVIVAVLGWQARRNGSTHLADQLDRVCLGFVLLAITMLIRHAFHADDMRLINKFTLLEAATYGVVWLSAGVGMLYAATRWNLTMLNLGGRALTGVGLAAIVLGPLAVYNPLFAHQPVGEWLVFNWLLYIYGVPAVLALLAARRLHRLGDFNLSHLCGLSTLILAFVLVTLQVRQSFHGAHLDGDMPANAEWYAYSAAWVLFAVTLLVLGIATQSKMIRYASLAVMVVAVGKVFLFDTRELEDLYRVMSFLGLGLSLFGLAYVYQRFVFRQVSAEGPSKPEHVST